MNKNELRTKYKLLRSQQSSTEVDEKSIQIANNLLQLSVFDATYFHVFLSIEAQNEVNTHYILHILQGKDKEIIVSKSNFETSEMQHFLMTESTRFALNKYQIPEPTNGIEIAVSKIEVVFVPLLAFDAKGNRVGYGKGFYDKFLSKCQPQTIKIGLSFFEAEAQIEDVHENDIRLDYCITPIYKFNSSY
jgi:5-formyltetrahydrofolate cyclo-ligase